MENQVIIYICTYMYIPWSSMIFQSPSAPVDISGWNTKVKILAASGLVELLQAAPTVGSSSNIQGLNVVSLRPYIYILYVIIYLPSPSQQTQLCQLTLYPIFMVQFQCCLININTCPMLINLSKANNKQPLYSPIKIVLAGMVFYCFTKIVNHYWPLTNNNNY